MQKMNLAAALLVLNCTSVSAKIVESRDLTLEINEARTRVESLTEEMFQPEELVSNRPQQAQELNDIESEFRWSTRDLKTEN